MARNPETTAASANGATAPKHATAWASLVYAVSTLLLAYPALGGAFLLNPLSDQYKAGYAFREFAASRLRSGQGFPQWNPFMEGGLPYIAAMHGDVFYPTFLLRMLLPTDLAMTWEFPIHVFLCGLFTYFFLRAWSFGFWGALVGGLAYMLGGSIAGLAGPGHDGKLFVATMLPLTLLLVTRGIRDGRLWSWGALALTIGLALLSPHPQVFQYMLLTSGCFALYVAFGEHPGHDRLERSVALKRLALAGAAVAVGMLIGAIQFWPALFEYKPWSPRSAGHDYATATSYSFPIEELLNAYWPQFSGILNSYWGRNAIHFHSDYFGVVVLMLAGAAAGQTRQRSFRRFWVVTGVLAVLWALGGYTPFFKLILAIPLFGAKYFRAPSAMIYVAAFSVSVLAAIGMERLMAHRVSPKYPIIWGIAGAAFAVLMSVGGYTALSTAVLGSMNGTLPPEYIDLFTRNASANTGGAILGVWRSLFFVAAAAGLMWALLKDRLAPRTAVIGLVVVLVVDLWSIERLYWTFSPRASQLFASDPAIDAIKADIAKSGEPGRVWTEERLGGEIVRDANFVGDGLMTHGLRLVGVYHGNELDMYDRLTGGDTRQSQAVVSPQFWRQENVRYLYTGASDSAVAEFASKLKLPSAPTKLAGPVRDAAGSMVFAYRLPGDMKPAWVATAMVKASEDVALGTVLNPGFDPTRVAIVDSSATSIQTQPLTALPEPATARASVTAAGDRSYDVQIAPAAPAGSALVVSENYYPGWSATADGKSIPVARMNFNLVGAALPTGARAVHFEFRDAAYEKGKVLTLIALALALTAWIVGWVAEMRRRTPVASPA